VTDDDTCLERARIQRFQLTVFLGGFVVHNPSQPPGARKKVIEMQARVPLIVGYLLFFSVSLSAQQQITYTWSSACQRCQSTVVYSNWYPDHSGLIAEGMSGTNAGALAALSLIKGNLVVSLGLSISHGPSFGFDPRKAVTLETDTAHHMVLYALEKPESGFHKGDLPIQRQFNANSVTLSPNVPVAGFLFFPADANASHITIVVAVNGEIFRFPFASDPNAHSKPGTPAKFSSENSSQNAAASSPAGDEAQVPGNHPLVRPLTVDRPANVPPAQSCTRNISFAVAEAGQVATLAPKFTAKWIEENKKNYPGLCFSQTPNARAVNFLIVFATSQSAFNGIYPTIRTRTSTDTSLVSGQDTVAGYGGTWTYTYNGIVTSNTTSTSYVNLPFTDTATSIYAYGYDQAGHLVSERRRTTTTRREGDSANTLGYNLGAALARIHFRERLLRDSVNDLTR
jgi:YD repeat-containing protein